MATTPTNQFWKPPKAVRSQINRGDKKVKEWQERIGREAAEERRRKRETATRGR